MDYEEKIKDKLGKNLKPYKSCFINNLTGSKNNEAPLQFLFEVQATSGKICGCLCKMEYNPCL